VIGLGLQLANGTNEAAEQLVREVPAAAEPNGAAASTEAAGGPRTSGQAMGADEKDNPGQQQPSAKKKKKGAAAGELEMERQVASVSGIMSQQVRTCGGPVFQWGTRLQVEGLRRSSQVVLLARAAQLRRGKSRAGFALRVAWERELQQSG